MFTSKFFTWEAGVITREPTWRSGIWGIWRYFNPMIRISVLSSFSFSIFLAYHSLISQMRASILATQSVPLVELNVVQSWQSLSYIWYCSPCLLMILPRGNIYIVKRIGPNTDPWGTPQVNGELFEFTPFIRTDCFLSERYDLNHWRATSRTPRWDCSPDKRMLWSMVSNAALKSRSNRMTHCFSSICLNISSCTEVNAVSVLWNFLYEDWNSSYRLLICMWSCNLSGTTRSIN